MRNIFLKDDTEGDNNLACVLLVLGILLGIATIGGIDADLNDRTSSRVIVHAKGESPLDVLKMDQAKKRNGLIDLLARTAAAESVPDDIEDMKDLLTVAMNRVDHPAWPDTELEVVGEFDGHGSDRYSKEPTDKHFKAATLVVDGYRSFDKSVLWYHNPNTATDTVHVKWCESQKLVKTNELKGTIFIHNYYKLTK